MDARDERQKKAILPDLSGPIVPGAMGVLAALLLAASVVAPALGGRDAHSLPTAAADPSRLAHPAAAEGPLEGPALPPAAPATGRGAPPVIERVSLGPAPPTALHDLQLAIHASDPDGDPVRLLTRWSVDGEALETDLPVLPRARLTRGARIRATVVASDGIYESPAVATETVTVENAPPRITSFPSGFDAAGAFAYAMAAIDPDGDRDLEYRLVEGPAGMVIDAADGRVRWLPTSDQIGRHSVEVEVRDGRGASQVQVFDLHVRRPHRPAKDLAVQDATP